ncbi:MAG TPA: hypothetical protein VK084_08365 [Chitinophagaceae bacterium]|nr:hypothetical protein [Chitinophagaceae bacterium]
MKKLKLEELNLGNDAEVLSREELKKVLGGMGSGSGGGSGSDVTCTVKCPSGDTSCSSSEGDCEINTDFWGVVRSIRCEDKTFNCVV